MMYESEIQEQVNKKFIRPTYRPFDDKPKKIFMRNNEIPTYKIQTNTFNKTPIFLKDEVKQEAPIDLPREPKTTTPFTMRNFSDKQPIHQKHANTFPLQTFATPSPITPSPQHNCCNVYNDIQNCPVCKTVYNSKDGVYIAVIVILSVIILFLLKKLFIDI